MKLADHTIALIQGDLDREVLAVQKDDLGIHRERANTVQILCSTIENHYEKQDGGIENMVHDGSKVTSISQIEVIETFYRQIRFVDDLARQLFVSRALSETNNNNKQSRVAVRNLINTIRINLDDYIDFYQDFINTSGMFLDRHTFKQSNLDIEYLRNNEWITVYRGFNTKKDEAIRTSNNKNKADYYRQKEGMGFSFSLNKRVAFVFSIMYQVRVLRRSSEYGHLATFKQLAEGVKDHRDRIGRASVGRYVIHRDNIKAVELGRAESEVMCDYRDAKLIDYKFVSDLDFNSKALENITQGQVVSKQVQQVDTSDGWINKHWKTDYKVKKDIESLLLKTKK